MQTSRPFVAFLVLLLACGSLQLISQVPSDHLATDVVLDKYANESIVIVRSDSVYYAAPDGTGWRQQTVVAKVQSDAAVKQLGVLSVAFAGSSERVEIAYARVRRPDGTVVGTPVEDALEMPDAVTQAAPFYSDLKQKQLPIRSLRKGDTLEWQAKIVRTKAEVPGEFWGQEWFLEDGVVLQQTIELHVSGGKPVTIWSPSQKPVESTNGGERIYRWKNSQLTPTTGKEAESIATKKKTTLWTAEQEIEAREGRLPTVAWTTFPSWEAVGAWYRGLEGDRAQPGPEVRAKVAELTAGKKTEEEKIRAVYDYVSKQIRYIGIAFGVGRYQPHRASEVLENQYGDCKDKHTLLAAMLNVLGVKSDAVLVGAGVRFNQAVPSPAAFNHLITRAQVGGQPTWLDATTEVAPYRMLIAGTRDHQVLVIPDTGVAKVDRTPADLPFKAFQKLEAVGSLDKDGISTSKMTLTVRGDVELLLRAALRQIPPAQYDQFVQNISQSLSFGGTTSHSEIIHGDDTTEPLAIRYDYRREKAGDWDNLKTLAQLAPVALPIPDEKEPPIRAIDLGGVRVESSTSEMKLPEGWGAELPEAVHSKSKYANWDQTYRLEKGTLYAERKVEVLVDRVPVAEWKEYKRWTDVTTPGSEQYVQLTRGTSKDTEGTQSTSTNESHGKQPHIYGTSAEAGQLVASATTALQQGDLILAGNKLNDAKAVNDSQAFLWSGYAYLALRKGEMSEALRDYQKEVMLHPDEVGTYVDIARLEGTLGKRADEIAHLRKYLAVQPAKTPVVLMLVRALMDDNDAKGAVEAAEAGVRALPEDKRNDESLMIALGQAQLKAGAKAEGTATLTSVLKTAERPWTLNTASYELADAGEELALAESSTRAALAKLAEESKAWTLDEKQQTLVVTSSLITATWDTMGWVLYREGKTKEAEGFLRAAWMNRQDAVVGEHLGDVLNAEGEKMQALRIYRLALAAVTTYDALGQKLESTNPIAVRLRGKIKPISKGQAEDETKDHTTLQAMRKLPLGPADGPEGTAEYKLLLGSSGVERAVPTGQQEVAGGAELIKKAQLTRFWPEGSDARLVRLGMLNCFAKVCELVLEESPQ